MPSTSKKQHNFMAAVANNPTFAKKVGVPQTVGRDFANADKGKTFKRGGDMATKMGKPVMKKGMSMAKDGMKRPTPMANTSMMGMKKGGMASGGMPMVMKDGKKVPAFAADGEGKMKKGGMAGMHKMPDGKMMKDSAMKKMNMGGMSGMGGMAKGGGVESKGKTKGKMITMKSGGSAKKYC
jgi:hypothetical protein